MSGETERRIIEGLQQIADRLEAIEARLGPAEPKKYLTVREAAKVLGISEQATYRLKVIQVKVGRSVRICQRKLDKYLARDRI